MAVTVLAIDPGPTQSGWIVTVEGVPAGPGGVAANETLLDWIHAGTWPGGVAVLERVESFGMAVGAEVFETVFWTGRFAEALEVRGTHVARIGRRAVKLELCGSARAKDANVRQALLDRFGGSSAKGTKASPGPLYGIASHVWSALAVAITYTEQARRNAA